MWIERIAVENFLVFRNISIRLECGFNVVFAPNEGGKSSLFRAITTGLFIDASSRSVDVKALARWGSADLFRIELDMMLGGCRHRLVRDFRTREQEITVEGGSAPVARGRSVEAYLSSRLPLADRGLFLRIAAVRHEELSRVGEGSSSIGERLEEMLGGTGEVVPPARVAVTLEEKRRELLRGVDRPAKEENWGLVKRLSEERREATLVLDAARDAARRREELSRAIADRRAALRGIESRLESIETRRKRAERHRDIAERAARARTLAEGLRQKVERIRRLAEERVRSAAALDRFPDQIRAADPAELGELRAALERERAVEGDRRLMGAAREARPSPAALVASICIAAAGILLGFIWHRALFLAAAAGAGIVFWCLRRRLRSARERSAVGTGELGRLRESRQAWAGARSLSDARVLLDEAGRLQESLRDLGTRLEEATGAAPEEHESILRRLDAEYGDAALESRALYEELARLEPFAADAERMVEMEGELAEAAAERSRLKTEIERFELALAAVAETDAAGAAERFAVIAERFERADRRARAFAIAAEALEEARRGVSFSLAERLPDRASGYVSRLTDGRYEALSIDPRTLAVMTAPASGDGERGAGSLPVPPNVAPEDLSQGARDLVYFAVRLALVDILGASERQPLFLDDPFVHLDPERRARAVDLVREFSAGNQVVFFTCDPSYRAAGGNLIELAL